MTHYLKVSFKDGSIYETSKEPQEGLKRMNGALQDVQVLTTRRCIVSLYQEH